MIESERDAVTREIIRCADGPDAGSGLAADIKVASRLLAMLRLLEKATGKKWPGIDLRQLALAEWMATPQWDKPQSEKSLVGWCVQNRVP